MIEETVEEEIVETVEEINETVEIAEEVEETVTIDEIVEEVEEIEEVVEETLTETVEETIIEEITVTEETVEMVETVETVEKINTENTVSNNKVEEEVKVEETMVETIEMIAEEEVPMAINNTGSWALVNLMTTAASMIIALSMVVSAMKNRKASKLAVVIPAALSLAAVLMTQDLNSAMALTDSWTVAMVMMMAITMVVAYLVRNRKEDVAF